MRMFGKIPVFAFCVLSVCAPPIAAEASKDWAAGPLGVRMGDGLVLMDAFLPGVDGWRDTYDNPRLWHFRFHGPTAERLVAGREREYFEYYWNEFASDPQRSIHESERQAYTDAYARPGRTRAAWAYFDSFS